MSSIEYAELAGLKIALQNLKVGGKPDCLSVMEWIEFRIKELTSKMVL